MEHREWKKSDLQTFWGDIARNDHLVQLYENEKVFLDTLEGYAGCALLSGDSIVIIATKKHLDSLNARLKNQNFRVEELAASGRILTVDVNTALSNFMVDGIPDEELFNNYINGLICAAAKDGRHVRAFGEMVSELWQNGFYEATAKLQVLWANLHANEKFSLFCAYPVKSFQHVPKEKFLNICTLPSKLIDGRSKPSTEIHYNNLDTSSN